MTVDYVNWKKRKQQIDELRQKHGRDRSLIRSFPDLSVEQRTASCSNSFSPTCHWDVKCGRAPGLMVGALNKSCLQVVYDPTAVGKKV